MKRIEELTAEEKATLRSRVFALYREADAEIAAAKPVCVASGKCCRFAEYGHTLFLSNLEADVLLATAPAYEKPSNNHFCPFQKGNLCTARTERPLGCRVYFCDPNYAGKGEVISEKYIAQLKELSQELQVEWNYAPLHFYL